MTDRFDPVGIMKDPPPATPLVRVLEISYPFFALAGAYLTPRILRWLLIPSDAPATTGGSTSGGSTSGGSTTGEATEGEATEGEARRGDRG